MESRAFVLLRRLPAKRSLFDRLLHWSPSPTPTPISPLPFSALRTHIPHLDLYKSWWISRNLSYGSVNLVVSDGRPRFQTHETEQPAKEKYRSKKRLKLQRKRDKRKRKEANKRDPRRIRPKGKKTKDRFPTAEARIKYKIEKAKIKEAILVEKLKRYEVPKVQGPDVEPEDLTGEERFFLKKMAQKKSNYVPVGRRGIFGGVILNMHLHWKKHETVKVICKPCKPGQVHEYARDIARLSGGVPIQIVGNDTIIFYRGKNYVQPEVMSPIDTLSKKKALEKSKYEQSLETVKRFIAIAEKELELYYRHVALYGDPNSRNADTVYGDGKKDPKELGTGVLASTKGGTACRATNNLSLDFSDGENFSSSDDNMSSGFLDELSIIDEADTDFSDAESMIDCTEDEACFEGKKTDAEVELKDASHTLREYHT